MKQSDEERHGNPHQQPQSGLQRKRQREATKNHQERQRESNGLRETHCVPKKGLREAQEVMEKFLYLDETFLETQR